MKGDDDYGVIWGLSQKVGKEWKQWKRDGNGRGERRYHSHIFLARAKLQRK
jgi:hypothetical protein